MVSHELRASLAILVTDEERGIPPDELLRLFRRHPGLEGGIGLGAADYIVKPFSPTELIARVRAALRPARSLRARRSQHPRNLAST